MVIQIDHLACCHIQRNLFHSGFWGNVVSLDPIKGQSQRRCILNSKKRRMYDMLKMVSKATVAVTIIIFTFINAAFARQAEIIFIDAEPVTEEYEKDIRVAAELFGIEFKRFIIENADFAVPMFLDDAEAVVITGNALKYWENGLKLKMNISNKASNILALGLGETSLDAMRELLGENIQLITLDDSMSSKGDMRFNDVQINFELGGISYPVKGTQASEIFAFEYDEKTGMESIAKIVLDDKKKELPVFLHKKKKSQHVFALGSWNEFHPKKGDIFNIAPILVYLKTVFGERVWHRAIDYANLTIDDPWLREPYGFISFAGLCRQASDVPFHATIGFIPFNFNINKNEVVNIFQECSKQLSIAVHGNNHDFVEFRTSDDSENRKSVVQAIERMESFERYTNLPYDRVMVFPRNAFTKETFNVLKKQNFLMTANSGIPLNADGIENPIDKLRGLTLEFENFPMVIRQGLLPKLLKEKENLWRLEQTIRMRLFLDLPVMLYTHHDFFEGGIGNFNSIAMMVNQIQPKIAWTSLGEVAANLYLQRRLNKQEIEVIAFSPLVILRNTFEEPMQWIVKKREDGVVPIKRVLVNDIEHAFSHDDSYVNIKVLIEPGIEKKVVIQYNDLEESVNFAHAKIKMDAIAIRKLTDLRDNYLYRLPLGSSIIAIIYKMGGNKKVSTVFAGIGTFILISYVARRKFY
jgi:hypothetical protein